MKKLIYLISILFVLISGVKGQQFDNKDVINKIYTNINKLYYEPSTGLYFETNQNVQKEKPHSYLWPLCALLQATNEMESLAPSADYMQPVLYAIQQYYNTNLPAPAYQAYVTKEEKDTRYYDDNQWLGITFMDAYQRTKNESYLDMAKGIYKFMMTGMDTVTGGGIYWREGDKSSKNTCSNGPGIILALQLYMATNQRNYLDSALLLYNWSNKYLISPDGIYYDAIEINKKTINKAKYTYNTGTMLQSNVLLFKITADKKYLDEAQRIAKAAETFFYKDNRLPNNYWFNAVMFRGFIELYIVDNNKKQLKFIIDDAKRVWNEERDIQNLLGPGIGKKLLDQAGMLEIYARIQQLNAEM